jgi:hypothetical protein
MNIMAMGRSWLIGTEHLLLSESIIIIIIIIHQRNKPNNAIQDAPDLPRQGPHHPRPIRQYRNLSTYPLYAVRIVRSLKD